MWMFYEVKSSNLVTLPTWGMGSGYHHHPEHLFLKTSTFSRFSKGLPNMMGSPSTYPWIVTIQPLRTIKEWIHLIGLQTKQFQVILHTFFPRLHAPTLHPCHLHTSISWHPIVWNSYAADAQTISICHASAQPHVLHTTLYFSYNTVYFAITDVTIKFYLRKLISPCHGIGRVPI